MTFLGGCKVVICIDDLVLSHVRHMLHVVSNPALIFDKSSSSLGLDLGYSLEELIMGAVVHLTF